MAQSMINIRINFAVVSFVCCNRLAGCESFLAGDCEALAAYAVFDFG